MDNNTPEIDALFRSAFEDWAPELKPGQMEADWNAVQQALPGAGMPAGGAAAGGASAGSVAGWIGGAVAVAAIGGAIILFSGSDKNAAERILNNTVRQEAKAPVHDDMKAIAGENPDREDNSANAPQAGSVEVVPGDNNKQPQSTKLYAPRADNSAPQNNGLNAGNGNAPDNAGQRNAPVHGLPQGEANTAGHADITKENAAPRGTAGAQIIVNKEVLTVGDQLIVELSNLPAGAEIHWGDKTRSTANAGRNSHVYTQAGTYIINVPGAGIAARSVRVCDVPIAAFGYSEESNRTVRLENRSRNARSVIWLFAADEDREYGNSPRHTFKDTGMHKVGLVAVGEAGRDTVYHTIYIRDKKEPVIYNVFTPNGDGINEVWQVEISGENYFRVEITDERGRQIYRTENSREGWDGRLPDGSAAPIGQYNYRVCYSYPGMAAPIIKIGQLRLNR